MEQPDAGKWLLLLFTMARCQLYWTVPTLLLSYVLLHYTNVGQMKLMLMMISTNYSLTASPKRKTPRTSPHKYSSQARNIIMNVHDFFVKEGSCMTAIDIIKKTAVATGVCVYYQTNKGRNECITRWSNSITTCNCTTSHCPGSSGRL